MRGIVACLVVVTFVLSPRIVLGQTLVSETIGGVVRDVTRGPLPVTSLPFGIVQSAACEPDGKVRFICGVVSPEDLVRVPRSDWVIASGYVGGAVVLIHVRDHRTVQAFPTSTARERWAKTGPYSACPGPVDAAEKEKASWHGLAVAAGPDRVHTVFVVHHGFRESIEVFEIDTAANPPTFTWIGCVLAPDRVNTSATPLPSGLNSVSPLPGGGFVATNSRRRGAPAAEINRGEVLEWNPGSGWRVVPGSESQGPNGIEASPDGTWLYVNLHPARKVMRLSRGRTPVTKDLVDVAFQPDNIRWQADGTLLAAGHGGPNIERVLQCIRRLCPDLASVVARIDPHTLKVEEIIRYPGHERFFNSTAALQVGDEVWIGTIDGDRIARYPIR